MFGINTEERISKELLTSYAAWDVYVSRIWASLLTKYQVPLSGTLVEIAPGASSKIALALKQINFSGHVYLIEPYKEALELVSKKFHSLLPNASIFPLAMMLNDSHQFLPKQIDCIISHHPLDDMLMATDASTQLCEKLFSWVLQDKLEISEQFSSHWQMIFADPQKINRLETIIINQWLDLIKQVQPHLLMLSQYPSLVLETETMNSLNCCAQNLLAKLKLYLKKQTKNDLEIQNILNNNLNYNFDLIGNEVLHAKNWLVYENHLD